MALVIVSGALANKPGNGGNAWSRLSWILGFRKLGFDVCFVEHLNRNCCVDPAGAVTSFANSVNLAYFRSTMRQFGLSDSCALIYQDGEEVWGLPLEQLELLARKADLLFNLSGHLTLQAVKEKIQRRVYYDDDPGFTQFWHADHNPGARLGGHEFYFTIGENIGKAGCEIPTGDVAWRHTRPPVVLEEWPAFNQSSLDRFTTIASWRGAYGPIRHNGKTYGLKVHEFRKFIELPRRSGHRFEIALQIHPADKTDLEALLGCGWLISDPKKGADSLDAFRRFVQSSGAEFSVAQGIYVDTNSGWFSDRTVRYLASGKPALVQDTGFSANYPTGDGLVAFRTMSQAIEGAESIARDYAKHSRAARNLAERCFDSDKVIRELAAEIDLALP